MAAFSTFDTLSAWGKTLPAWQRCLLGKLLEASNLSDDHLEEVFGEYLLDQGLVATEAARLEWKIELPQQQDAATAVTTGLATISRIVGVNALATGETLAFGPRLTVIYGPNGAGKSGYARLLKGACFTRSKNTRIIGDVKLEKAKQPKPSAVFSFEDGKEETFTLGSTCPRLRDGFAVFDASCIRVHLDDRNAFQVMPYLFDVFPRMVEAFGSLQSKLRLAISERRPEVAKFAIADSETEVATLLQSLSDSTDLARLRTLAQFGDQEQVRLVEIEKQVSDLRTKDPKEIIRSNEQKIEDLKTVKSSLSTLAAELTPAFIAEITNDIANANALVAKGAALSAARFGNEPVQPIGTSAWRELLSAAIAYNEEAYPDATFPPGVDGARCVLCQQTLDVSSADRLARFYAVVTSSIETDIQRARRQLSTSGATLNRLTLDFFELGAAARRTLHELDTVLESDIEGHIEGYRKVADVLARAITDVTDPGLDLLDYDSVSSRLGALIDRLQADNDALRLTDQQQLIGQLSKEKALLEDRKLLSTRYDDIAAAVDDLRWVTKASNALRAFSVTQREVTTKQKAMMEDLVAQGFVQRFIENCGSLRLTLPVKFKFAGEAGSTDRKIELAGANVSVDPSEVMSEGEQTAAALADFLTEFEVNGNCVGLIFDDPVTSMDHMRKESIAERLVEEATKRQVIVFTHDILFTNYLASAAEDRDVPFTGRTIWRDQANVPGAIDRIAFPHEHYEGAAHDRAKKHLQAAKALTGDAQRDVLEKACGSLRTAYEDFIQKKLFGNVVRRWRENITFTLDKVCFDEGIAARINERMAKLSRYIDAHSHSPEFHQVPLTTDIVAEESLKLDEIKSEYSRIYKAWEAAKKRPSVFE